MSSRIIIFSIFCFMLLSGCQHRKQTPLLNHHDIVKTIAEMTEVMMHDVTNPPLAARFFAYACLAGYEVVSQNDSTLPSMQGVLNSYPIIEKPDSIAGYDYRLTAILAMLKMAEKLQPSGSLLIVYEKNYLDSCRRIGFTNATIDNSLAYALLISTKILAYAKADRYNRISNYSRYTESSAAGAWHPTPPAYLLPVEPYFNTIRPMTLDSAAQFFPKMPIPFSTEKKSAFLQLARLNYEKSAAQITTEERDIANFWDCNPFAVQNDGHMLIGLKKISPGAHWMAITGSACAQKNYSFSKTLEILTAVSIGLLDGFISCWDGKFRTNRIRPETAIRNMIDVNWKPLLQTPPFPEYPSGHSVVSSASAVILTHYFGDNFSFIDSAEVAFGIPPRQFKSFQQASQEAAMSRFWGGIHFMDAIENGLQQGSEVGQWVVFKMKKSK